MPAIKEYQGRTSPGGPIAPPGRKAGNAGAYIAEGISELGKGIAQAGATIVETQDRQAKRVGNEEVLDYNKKLSEFHTRSSATWSEAIAKADPNDKELAQKYVKAYDDEIVEMRKGITTDAGREFFERNAVNLRGDFSKTAYAGQAHLASVAAKQNYVGALNASSASLMNDPTSYEAVSAMHRNTIGHLKESGEIPADKLIELEAQGEQELSKSAIRGWIKASPETAKHLLDEGRFDGALGGDVKKQLYGEITVEENARQVKVKQNQANQVRAERESQKQTYDSFVTKSEKHELNVDEVLNSNLPGEKKEHFIKAIKGSIDTPNRYKTDPDRFNDLFHRIAMTDPNDPTAIVDEEQLEREFHDGGGLSFSDFGKLRAELARGKTDEGKIEQTKKNHVYSIMKDSIYRGAGPKDPQAPELYMRAQRAYDMAYAEGKEKGKSDAELTDPDFVTKIMKPFIRTPQVKLKETAAKYQTYKTKVQGKNPKEKHSDAMEILRKKGLIPSGK